MKFNRVSQNSPNAMRLQGIGVVQGTPAGELKPGDVIMWNFGYKSVVVELLKETAKTVTIRSEVDGTYYERKMGKTRLVCVLIP